MSATKPTKNFHSFKFFFLFQILTIWVKKIQEAEINKSPKKVSKMQAKEKRQFAMLRTESQIKRRKKKKNVSTKENLSAENFFCVIGGQ